MTEKQEKQKVRRVIWTGMIYKGGHLWGDPVYFPDLKKNTPIEIVALLDAEPERRVVKPEGAKWVPLPSRIATKPWMGLYSNGRIVAIADGDGDYLSQDNWVLAKLPTIELAQQAAEEAKATADEDGFCWKEVEPEYTVYWIAWVERNDTCHVIRESTQSEASARYVSIKRGCSPQTRGYKRVRFLGVLPDLTMVELDRYEAEENP